MPEPNTRIRSAGAADLAWIASCHRELYAQERCWDASFGDLVDEVVAAFSGRACPRERAWIAELDGRRAGSVMCTDAGGGAAKLRVLLVEPWARGKGIGSALVQRCVDFARAAGYERLELWTTSDLAAARRLYERAGFALAGSYPEQRFGACLTSEDWGLEL